ncbi:MAG: hypothetical protein WAT91_10780 [Saprospiraceae bacterium]
MLNKLSILCLFLSFLMSKNLAQSGDSTSVFTIRGYVDGLF